MLRRDNSGLRHRRDGRNLYSLPASNTYPCPRTGVYDAVGDAQCLLARQRGHLSPGIVSSLFDPWLDLPWGQQPAHSPGSLLQQANSDSEALHVVPDGSRPTGF